MNRLTIVRKNLFRKKTRSALLLLSVSVAFLMFGALGAFYKSWNSGAEVAADNRLITVNRINFTVSMPYAYYGRVQQVEGVSLVSHANWFGGYYREPANFLQTFAIEPDSYLNAYPELVLPAEQRARFISDRTCLLAGESVAEQWGWQVGDQVPLQSNIFTRSDGADAWTFELCGIFTGDEANVPTNYAMFHYELFNETIAFGRDALGWFIVLTDSAAINDQVIAEIDALFANSAAETETSTEAAFNEAFAAQFGNIALILILVLGAAFATILMIVGTTMVLAISERTKEIAVLKTLGFRSNTIFTMVLSESILLAMVGGAIGLGIAGGLLSLAAAAPGNPLPGLGLTPDIIGIAVALMILLGLCTGLAPAWTAQRLKIIDAFAKS